jgi:hypothetical protein
MPNWCCNNLEIEGTEKELLIFYKENKNNESTWKNKNQELDFYKSVPIPKDHEENWYNWNNQNLGTKWNVSDAQYEFCEVIDINSAFNTIKTIYLKTAEKNHALQVGTIIKKIFTSYKIIYVFETAWEPPVPWVTETSKKYPNLKFRLEFEEMGCDFCGVFCVENGICINNVCESLQDRDYRNNKKEINTIIKNFFQKIKNDYKNDNIDIQNLNIDINNDMDKFSKYFCSRREELQENLEENEFYFSNDFLLEIIKNIKKS